MRNVANFGQVILEERLGPRVIEKLAGNTPKSALFFYQHHDQKLLYKVLNLGNSAEEYFNRAQEICGSLGIDFRSFKKRVNYIELVNIYHEPIYDYDKFVDSIVYWGAATKCLQTFEGDREQHYLDIISQERKKGIEKELTELEVHKNIRRRHQKETFRPIKDRELAHIIEQDLLALNDEGKILTNPRKDTQQVRKMMRKFGLVPRNYFFKQADFAILPYEHFVTVWHPPKPL